jgi:hypothetical protein
MKIAGILVGPGDTFRLVMTEILSFDAAFYRVSPNIAVLGDVYRIGHTSDINHLTKKEHVVLRYCISPRRHRRWDLHFLQP